MGVLGPGGWAAVGSSPPPSSQEAHKMVREANTKQAASEKQLKEAWGKVSPTPARSRQTPHGPAGTRDGHPEAQRVGLRVLR